MAPQQENKAATTIRVETLARVEGEGSLPSGCRERVWPT